MRPGSASYPAPTRDSHRPGDRAARPAARSGLRPWDQGCSRGRSAFLPGAATARPVAALSTITPRAVQMPDLEVTARELGAQASPPPLLTRPASRPRPWPNGSSSPRRRRCRPGSVCGCQHRSDPAADGTAPGGQPQEWPREGGRDPPSIPHGRMCPGSHPQRRLVTSAWRGRLDPVERHLLALVGWALQLIAGHPPGMRCRPRALEFPRCDDPLPTVLDWVGRPLQPRLPRGVPSQQDLGRPRRVGRHRRHISTVNTPSTSLNGPVLDPQNEHAAPVRPLLVSNSLG